MDLPLRELEVAKANRAAMKNKNRAKIKKGQTLKAKKKHILSCTDNPVSSTNLANNEATICPGCEQSYDEDCIQHGLCKVGWLVVGLSPIVCLWDQGLEVECRPWGCF